MKTYKPKLGLEIIIPISLIFGWTIYHLICEKAWTGVILNSMALLIISYIFLTTKYIIDKENLYIKSSFFYNLNIEIKTIRKVSKTYNILSSPATSIERLEIFYNKFDSILISPKEKKEFINNLLEINPNIEVKK